LNGSNGWRRLSRRALKLANAADFTQYAMARRLPRESLHAKLAQSIANFFERQHSEHKGAGETTMLDEEFGVCQKAFGIAHYVWDRGFSL
jgi:hypothetical protein